MDKCCWLACTLAVFEGMQLAAAELFQLANWQVHVHQLAGACMIMCQTMPGRLFMSLNAAADSHSS